MEENDVNEKMNEAIELLHKNKNPVLMYKDGVPKPTLNAFQKMAHDEFNGNYGFTLKYLLDFHNGIINAISPELEAKIGLMEARIEMLEKLDKKDERKEELPKKKMIQQADGSFLEVGK